MMMIRGWWWRSSLYVSCSLCSSCYYLHCNNNVMRDVRWDEMRWDALKGVLLFFLTAHGLLMVGEIGVYDDDWGYIKDRMMIVTCWRETFILFYFLLIFQSGGSRQIIIGYKFKPTREEKNDQTNTRQEEDSLL